MTIIGFFQLDELMGGDPYFAPDHSFAGALSGPSLPNLLAVRASWQSGRKRILMLAGLSKPCT
jgi:hypothetical protein